MIISEVHHKRLNAGRKEAMLKGIRMGRVRLLADLEIRKIHRLHKAGKSYQSIAYTLGVSLSTVSRTISRFNKENSNHTNPKENTVANGQSAAPADPLSGRLRSVGPHGV